MLSNEIVPDIASFSPTGVWLSVIHAWTKRLAISANNVAMVDTIHAMVMNSADRFSGGICRRMAK